MIDILPFLHPTLGLLTALVTLWLGTRGLAARRGAEGAHGARRRHRRAGPWVLGLMAASALSGGATVALVRSDLSLGDTWHFRLGVLSVALMAAGAVLNPRRYRQVTVVKPGHLALGLFTMLLVLGQALLGIELLP